MTVHATAAPLRALQQELRRHYGWELPASRVLELGRLAATTDSLEVLAEELAIGETFFFRDRKVFRALEKVVLPDLIRERMGTTRTISIWSAGCATGEEAYSVAALLAELLPDRRRWLVRISATDISNRFLSTARGGRYGKRSFRGLRDEVRDRFFRDGGDGTRTVKAAIRKSVSFAQLNLVTDRFPTGLDIILCRNVLMYFAPESARRVVFGLQGSLGPGGYLIVSPVESMLLNGAPLARATVEGAILYRKAKTAASPAAAPAAAVPHEKLRPAQVPSPGILEDVATRARACADRGELDAARALCIESLAQDRLDPRLHYLLARVLEAQGDLPGAMESLRRALYLDQDFIMGHVAAGMVARKLGRGAVASRHYRAALSLTARMGPREVLPDADGMSPRGLAELVGAILKGGV